MTDKNNGAEIFLQRMLEELTREGAFVPRLVFRNEGVDSPNGQGYDLASLEIEILTPHQPPEEEPPQNEIFTGTLDVERMMFTDNTGREYPILLRT